MIQSPQHIAVIGAGAWGTALAMAARRAGRDVLLWARDGALAARINTHHENPDYLPGVRLDAAIRASADVPEAAACDAVLFAVPAQHVRTIAGTFAAALADDRPVVVCAKGIERSTGALMSEVLAEVLPGRPVAVLSGPTFAGEVARGLPTAVTLAASDAALAAALAEALGSRTFRPYVSDDPLGAQIGGAVKNVIAIACGIVAGRSLGANAGAALITRGLAEIARLGEAIGARRETLMGLSGLGDLTLTCTSTQSRNFTLGQALGAGQTLGQALAGRHTVAEGLHSAAAVVSLAAKHGVEAPISAGVAAILEENASIDETIAALLARPFTAEAR
ncbi:MAG TPA: NAD(P)H-dependent glycerol-3-phosphate dehydrogenase [Kiloniellales bacterium]|jgi:glycerol-3-phosphate dehydrogenase (NAD(P)+)